MYRKVAFLGLVSNFVLGANIANAADVGDWDALEATLQTPDNVTLTQDIVVDAEKTITSAPNGGYVIDGGGFSITGKDGGVSGEYQRFFDLGSNSGSGDPLSVVNVTFKNFQMVADGLDALTEGGAIIQVEENVSLGDISANFTDNTVNKVSSQDAQHRFSGGAIKNLGTIGNIDGTFGRNVLQADITGSGSANSVFFSGAALMNQGDIGTINGAFSDNKVNVTGNNIIAQVWGGALRNDGHIGTIGSASEWVSFSNNEATATSSLSANAVGGAFSNAGQIDNFYASFSGNSAVATGTGTSNVWANGGALSNEGVMGLISLNALDNTASAKGGGMVYARGGAVSVEKTISSLSGYFFGNSAIGETTGALVNALGGAIYGENNGGNGIDRISASFYSNKATATATSGSAVASGGAIYSQTRLGLITDSLFNDNHVIAQTDSGSITANGGAISSTQDLVIQNTSFTDNTVEATTQSGTVNAHGGAVYAAGNLTITAQGANSIFADNSVIENINGTSTVTKNDIYMASSDKTLSIDASDGGIFQFNGGIDGANGYKIVIGGNSDGTVNMNGNILNASTITVNDMDVNFNPLSSSVIDAVINGTGYLNKLGTGTLTFNKEMNFAGTFNQNDGVTIVSNQFVSGDTYIRGGKLQVNNGAIVNNLVLFNGSGLDIQAGDAAYNLTGDVVFYSGATLSKNLSLQDSSKLASLTVVNGVPRLENGQKMTFTSAPDSTLVFANVNDEISSADGAVKVEEWNKINIGTDSASSNMSFFGSLVTVGTDNSVIINSGSTLAGSGRTMDYTITGSLINNGLLSLAGHGMNVLTLNGDYVAGANSVLALDVDPIGLTSDVVKISGDVKGTTRLQLTSTSGDTPDGKILFLEAPNDDLTTDASFEVWRVEGSLYDWQAFQDGRNWYFGIDKETITPEVASYASLPSIAMVQSTSMLWNLKDKVINAPRSYKKFCRRNYGNNAYSCYYDRPYNFWFAPAFSNVAVKYPFEYDANVYGGDAGLDVLTGDWGKFGIFASYRNGDFDIKGKGKEYKVSGTADVDVNSYFGGLYYNLEAGHFWALAAAYGGVLKGDIETDDKVRADTKGTQVGASLDMGYTFNLRDNWNIEPSVGVQYTRVDFDETKDSNKVTAEYEALGQVKASAGLKIEKYYPSREGVSSVYFEPSVIKTYNSGNTVKLMNSLELPTVEDDTYLRVNVGGSLQLSEGLKAFGTISNTFNSDFRDTSINIGLNYAF